MRPIDLEQLKTYPLAKRKSKVSAEHFARSWQPGAKFADFLKHLPHILAGSDIRKVISAIATAFQEKKQVLFGLGAHVIKVGLNPIIIDLMERGVISGLALNGAGIIHDVEIAISAGTSEDVAATLEDGSFGMARETSAFLNAASANIPGGAAGLGETIGKAIIDHQLPHTQLSLLASAYRLKIPCTVHVAFGTDINHIHPDFDPGATGAATHLDFRLFAALVSRLEGGVYVNVGSAVILPEIFLKALTLTRNLGHQVEKFTTVNMDFIRHYRPMTNVVHRPTAQGGQGFNLIGHHEIMLPLIAAGVVETLADKTFSPPSGAV